MLLFVTDKDKEITIQVYRKGGGDGWVDASGNLAVDKLLCTASLNLEHLLAASSCRCFH
jgi:hypothetical protein